MLKRQTHRANESFLKSAANFEHSSSQKKYPSIKELQNLLQKVRNHPVAGVKIAPRYDPNGAFGLCYGRALVTHTLLLQQGFHIVAKVFALGPLRFNGRLWDFHVALLVPRAKGQWWVMDSNETSVLPLERWMQKIKGLDRDPRAPSVRFYLTDASKFLPHKGEYSTMDFGQLQPKRFFEDLLAGSPMQ